MSENTAALEAAAVQMNVAAQQLSFQAGLYLITFNGDSAVQLGGIALPRVRIDPLPPTADMPGRAYVARLSEGQWLDSTSPSTFLRVEGGAASVILTTYNAPGEMPPPTVRVRLVQHAEAAAGLLTAVEAAPQLPELLPPGEAEDSLALTVMVHCATLGDITVDGGQWAGANDPRCAVEGFSIAPSQPVDDVAVEYQSIMGVDWSSPWVSGPELSGSRGLALPLFGLRARLVGAQAHEYELVLWARAGNRQIGPVLTGEIEAGPAEPLSALKVALRKAARLDRTSIFSRTRRQPAARS